MLIIGRRVRRKYRGRVAGFCPITRRVRSFRVLEHRKYTHLYYIPLGFGKPIFETIQPEGERFILQGEPSSVEGPLPKSRKLDLRDLIELTNPTIEQRESAEHEAEERLLELREMHPQRVEEIRRRVSMLEYTYLVSASGGRTESVTAIIALLAISFLFTTLLVWHLGGGPWWILFAALTAVFVPWLIYRTLVTGPKAGAKAVMGYIPQALWSLAPSQSELRAVHKEVTNQRLKIAKAFNVEAVDHGIQQRIAGIGPHKELAMTPANSARH